MTTTLLHCQYITERNNIQKLVVDALVLRMGFLHEIVAYTVY